MRKVNAIIERASDGTYSIYSDADDLSYLITGTGNTLEEAKKCFADGYEDMHRYYAKIGKPFTEVEMVYQYDMASFLAYYTKTFSLAGLSHIMGIKQDRLANYITGTCTPSARTREKMQKSIHAFAEDLNSACFV